LNQEHSSSSAAGVPLDAETSHHLGLIVDGISNQSSILFQHHQQLLLLVQQQQQQSFISSASAAIAQMMVARERITVSSPGQQENNSRDATPLEGRSMERIRCIQWISREHALLRIFARN
jgi:hypothetical protein